MMLQLGGRPSAEGRPAPGKAPGIGHEHTIRGLHCATLWVGGGGGREPIERVLAETFGFRTMHDDESTIRFDVSDSGAGAVNVRAVGGPVRGALATRRVHDADDATQLPTRTHLTAPGLRSTPVIDGMSFHSVEFRGPGGVLYEPPAEPPVGAIDEPVD
ncbi:MAG: hypothetical protein IRY91_08630 [Gemmatimonadaceae bacterium]|nr:hypothetical protein [Gemmatimonadaceae bacterium]